MVKAYQPGQFTRIHQLAEYWQARKPDELAFIDHDGRTVSWTELIVAVDEVVTILGSHDVGPGDRVALVSENCLATVAAMLAVSRLDAWCIPINARLTGHELENIIAHATPRALVLTSDVSSHARDHGKSHDVRSHQGTFGTIETAALAAGKPEASDPDAAKQVATLIYTTGTTGNPKAVMLTHENLLAVGYVSAGIRGLNETDRIYLALPLAHVFGLGSILMASLSVGAVIELAARFDPEIILEKLRDNITVFPAVPQMYAVLMQLAEDKGIKQLNSPSLRFISSGGAPLDPDWKARCEAFFGISLMNGYGLTETSGTAATTWRQANPGDVNVGHAIPGVDVRLAASRSADGTGEVLIKGPNVMKGYYKNEAATAAAFDPDGYLKTGDLGLIDDKGTLQIVGRSRELIIRSGFNVYPLEIEVALNCHPLVVQAAVVGRPTGDGNEEVLAFAQIPAGSKVTEDDLKQFLHDRLAPYKRPSRIVVAAALPAAATGKILKHKLLGHFADKLA